MKVKKAKTDGEWIRQMVWEGEFGFTASGLEKKDLVIKNGKIISKQVSENGKNHPWIKAVALARKHLKLKGFGDLRKGSPLYKKAKSFMKQCR